MDQVEVRLWTNEKMAPHVIPDASADVSHEVIAAEIIRTGNKVALKRGGIKTQALPTNTGHQLGLKVFPNLWSIDAIEVVKKWAVGLKSTIQVPTGPPGQFTTDTEVVLKKDVSAENGVGPTALGDGSAAPLGNRARRRRNGARAKGCVKLLAENTGLYYKKQA
jgi:hypothetical protein